MVNSCCVPECKSGYKSVKKSDTVSLFRFPNNEIIRQKWIKAIPRKNWSVTQNHRVCAHHFDESDFITESTDKRKACKQACTNSRLQRCHLKSTAVPHIFPSLPHYLSTNPSAPRPTTSSTSDARWVNENFRLKKQADLLFDSEKVANLSEFKEKINQEFLPSGYMSVTEDSSVSFYYIKKSVNNFLDAPLLLGTVIVTDKLEIQMFVSSTSIPTSSYHHLLQSSTSTIKTTTELLNLLSFCKSVCDRSTDFSANTCISLVVSLASTF